eukprot:GHVO01029324.1.p1 GENE.GHVO01029324.1~~GHVO01029324.1.p1  ORF type:complete len:206 (+),score=10.71 GHVO01029324.1:2-619(+)
MDLITNTPSMHQRYCRVEFSILDPNGNKVSNDSFQDYVPSNKTGVPSNQTGGSVFGTIIGGDHIRRPTGGGHSVQVCCEMALGSEYVEKKTITWRVNDHRIDGESPRYKDESGYEWWLRNYTGDGVVSVVLNTDTPQIEGRYCWAVLSALGSDGNAAAQRAIEGNLYTGSNAGMGIINVLHRATGGSEKYSLTMRCTLNIGNKFE